MLLHMHRLQTIFSSVSKVLTAFFGLLVIAGVILALQGYFAHSSQNKNKQTAQNSTAASAQINSHKILFQSPYTGLRFSYPQGWHISTTADPSSATSYITTVYAGQSEDNASAKIIINEGLLSQQLDMSSTRQLVNTQQISMLGGFYYEAFINQISQATGNIVPALYITTSVNSVAESTCPAARLPVSTVGQQTCIAIEGTLADTSPQLDLKAGMDAFKKSPYTQAMQDILASMNYAPQS